MAAACYSFSTYCKNEIFTLYSCNTNSEKLVATPSNFITYRIFIKCTLWYKGRQMESLRPNLRHYCIWVLPGNSWTAQASQKAFCNQRRLAIFPFFFLTLEHELKTVYSRISRVFILYTYIFIFMYVMYSKRIIFPSKNQDSNLLLWL